MRREVDKEGATPSLDQVLNLMVMLYTMMD
jgi:hypothetical protein